jgi:hypothetical protein
MALGAHAPVGSNDGAFSLDTTFYPCLIAA